MISFLLYLSCFLQNVHGQVISIDYGSSSYKVSIVKVGTPMEIVMNRESKRNTPPCVGFKENGRFIGSTAENIYRKTPGAATCDFHSLLGRNFSNPLVSEYISQHTKMEIKSDEARAVPIFYPTGIDMNFAAEDFLAQIINESTTVSGGVKTVVISMSPMIDHSTRNAMKISAKIVKVGLIGIVDSSTAATYQYLINKKSDILSGSSSVLLIFDVGASTTTSTIIKTYSETSSGSKHARGDILGIGFIPVGGNHITQCVYDILVERLKKSFQSHSSILENHRKKIALLSEAEKMKIVFSTAPETGYFMESFYEEKDFSGKVTREEFETKCKETFYKITSSIEDALVSANLTKEDLKSVVLLGKASRTFSLHPVIKEVTGKNKLSQVLNTEDSVAHGAAFKGAEISKQFKVAKISVHHAIVYPIEILYEKEEVDPDTQKSAMKQFQKLVYSHMSDATQRRTVTIHNVSSNITLRVQYGEIPKIYAKSAFMNQDKDLLEVHIFGFEDIMKANPKGMLKSIKVTFAMDTFGMIQVLKADAKFEKILEKSTLTKVMDSIGSVFGFGGNSTDDQATASSGTASAENQTESVNSTTTNSTINESANTTATNSTDSKNKTETPKKVRFQETMSLKLTVKELFFSSLADDQISLSYMKLKKIQLREMKKEAESKAKSDLEGYIYEMRERLEQGKDVHSALNATEYENATSTLEQVATWFEENGYQAGYDENTEKHQLLIGVLSVAEDRLAEKKKLDAELANFYNIANMSLSMVNESMKMPGAKEVLNASYLSNLTDMIQETLKNVREMHESQKKLKLYETPTLLSSTVKVFSSMIHSSVDEMISEIRKSSYKKKASERTSDKKNGTKTDEQSRKKKMNETDSSDSTFSNFTETSNQTSDATTPEEPKSQSTDESQGSEETNESKEETDVKDEL